MDSEETCPSCGRVDHPAYMCWRVGHLINAANAAAHPDYSMPAATSFSALIKDAGATTRTAELEAENERLRRALQNIAEFCVACPDTAQFAARVLNGRAQQQED